MSSLKRSAVHISLITLASSVVNLLVDILLAASLGAGASMDAYLVANLVPGMLVASLPSVLSSLFIPSFRRIAAAEGEAAAWLAASRLFNGLFLVCVMIVAALLPLAHSVIALTAPGLPPERSDLAASLLRWLLVAGLIQSLSGFLAGLCNATRSFLAPAVAGLLQNVGTAAGVYFLVHRLGVSALPIAICVSALAQFLLLAPTLLRAPGHSWRLSLGSDEMRRSQSLLLLMLLSSLVYQGLGWCDRLVGSFLPAGSLSYLSYGGRLGVFLANFMAVGIGTVAFVKFSEDAARPERSDFADSLERSMRALTLALLPALAVLLTVREPLLRLLFQRRSFTPEAALNTGWAVLCYAGLFFAVGVGRPLTLAFLALQDARTPLKINLACLAAYVPLSATLALPLSLGHIGLALASSLVHLANFVAHMLLLQRRVPSLDWSLWLRYARRVAAVSAVGILPCLALHPLIVLLPTPRMWQDLLTLAVGGSCWLLQLVYLWARGDDLLRELNGLLPRPLRLTP